MAEPTDNKFEYNKPLGYEPLDRPPTTKEAIPGVKIPKSTSTLPDSGQAGGLSPTSPETPTIAYGKPLGYEPLDRPASSYALPSSTKKTQQTLPEKPGFFKQAWEGTKEVAVRGLVAGEQALAGGLYAAAEAPFTATESMRSSKTLPDESDRKQWGTRADGSQKGNGWLGVLQRPDGKGVMTEFTVGTKINNKEMDIPTLVPTLSKEEVNYILNSKEGDRKLFRTPMGRQIMDKAIAHAEGRVKEGKSVFADEPSAGAKPEEGFLDKLHKNIKETRGAIEGMSKEQALQPTEYSDFSKHPISATLAGGARALPMMAPFAIPGVGQALGTAMFAGMGYQETYDKVLQAQLSSGKPEEEARSNAHQAGLLSGLIMGGGGYALSKGGGMASGLFRKAFGKGALTAEDVLLDAAGSETAKAYAKKFAQGIGTNIAAMTMYSALPVAVERAFGVTGPEEPTVWEAAKGSITPAVGYSIIAGIFGLAARTKPISDPRPNLEGKAAEDYAKQRAAAVYAIAKSIEKVDPNAANNFKLRGIQNIMEGKPIDLTMEGLKTPPEIKKPTDQTLPPTAQEPSTDILKEGQGSEVTPEGSLGASPEEMVDKDLEEFGKAITESPLDMNEITKLQLPYKAIASPEIPSPDSIKPTTIAELKKVGDDAAQARADEVKQRLMQGKAGQPSGPTIALPQLTDGGEHVDLVGIPDNANVVIKPTEQPKPVEPVQTEQPIIDNTLAK